MDQSRKSNRRSKYASLICLNCRVRKIKCILPKSNGTQLLELPQSPSLACERCKKFNLECIIQHTVLGRPAHVRMRVRKGKQNTGNSSIISNYILSDLVFDGDSSTAAANNAHASIEDFTTMTSPAHILSAIIAQKEDVGSVCVSLPSIEPFDHMAKHFSSDMIEELDAILVWHRFFLPLVPTLAGLHKRLVSRESKLAKKDTQFLFVLLCLLALKASSKDSSQFDQLYTKSQNYIRYHGEEFLFNTSPSRDTLAALVLLSNYAPTAMSSSRASAVAAIHSNVFLALAQKASSQLGIDFAHIRLSDFHCNDEPDDYEAMEACIADCLQYCQVLYESASLEGFLMKSGPELQRLYSHLNSSVEALIEVLEIHRPTARTSYHFYYIKTACLHLKCLTMMKDNWRDLGALENILNMIETLYHQDSANLDSTFLQVPSEDETTHEVEGSLFMAKWRIKKIHVDILSEGICYAMMCRLNPSNNGEEILPKEAFQVCKQVIETLEDELKNGKSDFYQFIIHFGHIKDTKTEEMLCSFASASATLKLNGQKFLPPPRQMALEVLMHCKNLIEHNAVIMKGHGTIGPRIEEQLLLFDNASQALESMAATLTKPDPRDICVYTACAKAIRDFIAVLVRWKADTRLDKLEHEPGSGDLGTQFGRPRDSELDDFLSLSWMGQERQSFDNTV